MSSESAKDGRKHNKLSEISDNSCCAPVENGLTRMRNEYWGHMNTKEKVIAYSKQLGWQLNDNDNQTGFWLREGSTFVDLIPKDKTDRQELLVFARVVEGARIDFELTKKLLQLNVSISLGAFALTDDGTIVFRACILGGDHMDIDEFRTAVEVVAFIADEFDDKIVSTHGGKTAVTAIEELQRERDRGGSLKW